MIAIVITAIIGIAVLILIPYLIIKIIPRGEAYQKSRDYDTAFMKAVAEDVGIYGHNSTGTVRTWGTCAGNSCGGYPVSEEGEVICGGDNADYHLQQ